MKNNTKVLLIILLLGCVLAVMIGIPLLRLLTVYPPGWEMYNQVGAVRHNDAIMDSEDDFTHPKELMGVYWKVDWDNETYGVPTIQVEMGDMRHVDFMGKEIPSTQPADTIEFERGNLSYYLDYHIYMYTVTIRTLADKTIMGRGATGAWVIYHETSWPYTWDAITTAGGTEIGEPFKGGVYVKFVIDPWQGFTYRDPPEGEGDDYYVLDSCWAGVMNTYVFDRKMGQVENQWGQNPSDEDGKMFVKGGLDQGNQVPMFLDDGSYGEQAPRVDWGPTVTPDERIESRVVQYLPVEMLPGADVLFGGGLGKCSQDVYPCDVYVMYTLRVDVLTTHGFVLHSAIHPPEPTPPTDWFTWAEDFWDGVFSVIGMMNPFRVFGQYSSLVAFLFILGLVIIVILVLLAIFAPWAFRRLMGETRVAYETVRGKRQYD